MGVLLWAVAAFGLVSYLLIDSGASDPEARLYLIPWCIATAVVVFAPSVYLYYAGRFDPFHPLVFAAWSYFFPGFVFGGLMIAFGLSKPYFLSYVADEQYNLPLTLVYVMLGYAGFTLGFVIPYARGLGHRIARRLPRWEWSNDRVVAPGFLLLGLGGANLIVGISSGVLGYQRPEQSGAFDTLLYLLSMVAIEAAFLLWLFVFRSRSLGASGYMVVAVLVAFSLASSAFFGSRGTLLRMLILAGFAYALAGRRFTPKHYLAGSVVVMIALVVGMIYGTTFRTFKSSDSQAGVVEMAEIIGHTAEQLTEQDLLTTLSVGIHAISERLDSVSALAVVVANHEALAPYEDRWGISNNIWNEMVISLIPRVVWPNKPIPIDPRSYAELYFNFGDSAFTITPMGDLLRNFGPIGVPLGMILLGFFVRVVYASLVEGQDFAHWRAMMFYMLFTSISFEGTFGLILPFFLRVGIVAMSGVLLVQFYFYLTRRRAG